MVGSNRKGTLLAAACGVLAQTWAGLAPSQQPKTAPVAASASDRIITLHEDGKALTCRVVSTWRLDTGELAYQVQVLATGEMLTIVEDGRDGRGRGSRAISMKIFHWGQRSTPPRGAPLPPAPTRHVAPGGTIVTTGPVRDCQPPVIISEGPSVLVDVTNGTPCVVPGTTR